MTDWRPRIATARGPRYAAIVQALAGDIEAGLLEPGDRLPTHRALADALGVSLGTVTRAYSEARQQGLVEGEVGRGTFVRDRDREDTRWALGAQPDRSVIDFGLLAAPPIGDSPAGERIRSGLLDVAREVDLDAALGYQPHGGTPPRREAGAEWIRRTGLEADPSEVLVTAGAQHAMMCALTVVARPGDVVMTEALTAPGLKDIASWMPLRLHGLPCDEGGLLPMAFEAACRLGVSRILYTLPVLHNPTTVTMTPERREEIAAIAARHGVAIIEDGTLALLAGDGILPMSSFTPESSYYLTSLSKTVAAGLRIGFLRVPAGAVSQMEDAIRATMWMSSPLLGEVAARWIADGTAEAVLEARREEARARQAIAARVLDGFDPDADPGGYHVWLDPGAGWQAEELVRAARASSVVVTPAEAFVAGRGHVPSRVRLSLSAPAGRAEVEEGLEILRNVMMAGPQD